MEPVLRQLSRLEAYYETDETILRLAGEAAKIYQRFGVDAPTDDMLLRELSLTVNIGLGFTNPQKRVERLLQGTDWPRDRVLGKVLPRAGWASVEAIAVAAAMAGCRGHACSSRPSGTPMRASRWRRWSLARQGQRPFGTRKARRCG